MIEIVQNTDDRKQFWKERRLKKSKELEKVYEKIAPGIPLVNVSFKELFLEKCEEYFEELIDLKSEIRELERWDSYEITRMFGKGLNPTSLKTAQNNVKYLVSKIRPQGKDIKVVEFGPGSGWSTVMLFNELRKAFPDKEIHLLSTDLSPHSIVSTQNTLDYAQIDWQTSLDPFSFNEIPNTANKVTLMLGDFNKVLHEQKDNTFDGFFSSHGTAYLSQDQYLELFKLMQFKGKDNSMFVGDSLDPLYTVQLDSLHLIMCSMFPSRVKNYDEYEYGESLLSNSKFFPGQEVKKLTKVHNDESFLFYYWNNYLIRKLRIGYLAQMMKSIKITTDVIEEYREDVYPSYLLKDLLMKEQLPFKSQSDIPQCPLYISNAAFILEKNEH